ncbi:MAG: nitrite reductase small subunit NirD [Deltaproteobacteria bacterium]|nr:nitrite reductase small subunit NirD [Deltaproteobacteria bacterium]
MGSRIVNLGPESAALFRLYDGSVLAIENACPHKGGPLSEGIVSGNSVICPMHNTRVDLRDGTVEGPDTGSVRTYEVKIEGEEVWIRL